MLAACEKGSKSFKNGMPREASSRGKKHCGRLADLIRTPIGSVGNDSALVQAYETVRRCEGLDSQAESG